MLRSAVLAVVVATVAAVAIVKFADAMHTFDTRADTNAATPLVDRELAGAHATDIDRKFVLAARRLLPKDARYIVETGDNVEVSSPVTLPSVHGYSLFWLLPRRQVRDTDPDGHPGYVLCFGCDMAPIRSRVRVMLDNGGGELIARFKR